MMFINNRINKQKGLAAIELTLILPFLLFLVFVIVEFSRLLYQYNRLNQVVRDASRYLINHARPISNDVYINDVIALNANAILTGGDYNGSSNILPSLTNSGAVADITTAGKDITYSIEDVYNFNILVDDTTEYITVSVTYYWEPIYSDLLPSFITSKSFNLNFPLTARYSMRAL
ncbi:TadE/TadG family type IV pilus assembly protein [Thalassotalea nanhaiensis]|uniref:TadE/TadG family type IV pilus assembly protein n=1 Tax=Thalassotalea nanhaiensis TaxID=3065648 RepID=A0ABY9TFU5_9GAMM|nr:TadE/TadG family type IV pilus assembly protein [Colwelliaceae bacterium SQ345]